MLAIATKTINDYTNSITSKGVSAILTALRNDGKLLQSGTDSLAANNKHLRTQLEKANYHDEQLRSDFHLFRDQSQQAHKQQMQVGL